MENGENGTSDSISLNQCGQRSSVSRPLPVPDKPSPDALPVCARVEVEATVTSRTLRSSMSASARHTPNFPGAFSLTPTTDPHRLNAPTGVRTECSLCLNNS